MNIVANNEVQVVVLMLQLGVVVVVVGVTGGDVMNSLVRNRRAVVKNKTKSRNLDHARTHSCAPGRHTRTLTHTLTAGVGVGGSGVHTNTNPQIKCNG